MKDNDPPIDEEYKENMVLVAKTLDKLFNGKTQGKDRAVGFVLLVFPFGDREGRANYISNGANRKDVVKLMKEQIKRFEE